MHLFLIDDHILFREGVKFLVADLADSVEFHEADSCSNALLMDSFSQADLILLDLYFRDEYGLPLINSIKRRINAPIVIVSCEEAPHIIRATINQGASGYIPKSSTHKELIDALHFVLSGGLYLPPIALASSEVSQHSKDDVINMLTKRQIETVLRAAKGASNKEISLELKISEGTVKAHLSAAYRTLGVLNRTEAVYAVAKLGLTPEGILSKRSDMPVT